MKAVASRYYALGTLGVLEGYNGLDRIAWAFAVQDVKRDFALSDTELGLLGGIAFALFYCVAGIPIARLADRGFRVVVISLSTAASGALVALCGATQTFLQLMLVRIGVAIGDAGCAPPIQSLIAAYFSRAARARATSLYLLASYLVIIVGTSIIGWLNELYGWRHTFMLLGLPGLALAVVAWFTLREPQAKHESTGVSLEGFSAHSPPRNSGLKDVLVLLWANRTFRYLLCAWTVSTFLEAGIAQWNAAFFLRSHGIRTGELGNWFSAITTFSIAGLYVGGELASRYAAHNERLQLRAIAVIFVSYGLLSVMVYMTPTIHLAFLFKAICFFGMAMTVGSTLAIIQTLVYPTMRAMSMAILLLISNLIGTGIGPLLVGAVSDALAPWAGDQSLRYILAAASSGYALSAWFFWQASRTVGEDLARGLASPDEVEREAAFVFFQRESKEGIDK